MTSGNEKAAEPDRVASIEIEGNQWTSDSPIRDAVGLYPGMLLPDEATLLRAEIRLLMRFHERFDLDAGKRPTVKVLPRESDSRRFRIVEVNFPERIQKKAPAQPRTPESSEVIATYQAYLEAIRKCDVEAARKCWVIDDNKSGALNVIVGMWISSRNLNLMAVNKFGEDGPQALPQGWRRDDFTNRAIHATKKRLADAKVEIRGNGAQLRMNWMHRDSPAFMYGESTITFRKVAGKWRIDGNIGLEDVSDFFEPGTWGPMFRDQVVIINVRPCDGMKKGKLKTPNQVRSFIDEKIAAMKEKYDEESKRAEGKCPLGVERK